MTRRDPRALRCIVLEELLEALCTATRTEDLAPSPDEWGGRPGLRERSERLARSLRRRAGRGWRFYAMCVLAGVGLIGAVLETRH
jgi:hypothetical protein